MNNGISLTEDDFSPVSDYLIYLNGNDETIKQILNNQAIVERFNQILSNHGTEPPKNDKTLTKVDDNVILQIHNVITNILSYIKDGTSPNGYSGVKKTVHSNGNSQLTSDKNGIVEDSPL